MDPVDPKRRGRRLFGGRRRHEHAAEAEMDQSTITTAPDAPASDGPSDIDTEATAAPAAETEPAVATIPDSSEARHADPGVDSSEATVVPELPPEPAAASGADSKKPE